MNTKHLILLFAAVSMIVGCESYSKFIKKELKIPYVYIPPNNLDHPYTLVQSTDESNFQCACSATLLTGLTEEQIIAKRRESQVSSIGIIASKSATFKVEVGKSDIGELDTKYTRINKVELMLSNGKLFTLPDVSLSEVVKKIGSTTCIEDIRILLRESPESKFYIPTQLYAYDIQYHIYTEDGTDVTAQLPKEVTKLVLAKIGVEYKSTSDITMAGNNLYVGFRGTSLIATLTTMIDTNDRDRQSPYLMFQASSLKALKDKVKEQGKVVDVTELIKEITAEK